MCRSLMPSLVFIIALMFMVSCSGGDENVIAPDPEPAAGQDAVTEAGGNAVVTEAGGTTTCLGLWQVVLDPATGTGDIVQLRTAEKILNMLGFMEPPVLTNMDLDWADLDIDFPGGTAEVGVILTHPINDKVFTGFDVRGVCFGPKVSNADGLTIIPSPEFFSGVPFGYQDGLLGAPDSYGNYEGLAGYKYFCDGIGEDEVLSDFFSDPGHYADRGKLGPGDKIQRNYSLDWNGTGYAVLVFNYAIYANYDWPVGSPPWDVDDWDINAANSAEAFCLSMTETNSTLYYDTGPGGGGTLSLDVEVWDWQGDIFDVTIESYGSTVMPKAPFTGGPTKIGYGGGAFSTYMYDFDGIPAVPTAVGDLDILITVTDSKTFGEYWFLDLLGSGHALSDDFIYASWLYTTTVIDCPLPTIVHIAPPTHSADGVSFPATITGTGFIDGTGFDVHLEKTGAPDIVPANVVVDDITTITCDITLPLSTTLGFWDIEVTNSCGLTGLGAGVFEVVCPAPTVTGINPASHDVDNISFPATITGTNFISGASLDVRLMRTGQSDIPATGEAVQNPTTITCTLQLPVTTALGAWNVRVTNGCGGVGTGIFTATCPAVTVTSINPNSGYPYGFAVFYDIYGTGFLSGPSLRTMLQKSGQGSIEGTYITVMSATHVRCLFAIPPGTAAGLWNVRVRNGCGMEGTGSNLFTVDATPVGNVSLKVQRNLDHSIMSSYNVRLNWSEGSNAVQYAIYKDWTPYGGITPTTYVGITSGTQYYDTCQVDGAHVYVVRARAIAGDPGSESADSQWAFVDFEQAENTSAQGSWNKNTRSDYYYFYVSRHWVPNFHLSGLWGWYNSWGVDEPNKWNVFYSDRIPEIPSASTYRLEVPWKVYCNSYSGTEDGLSFGYLTTTPAGGQYDYTCHEYRPQLPITGLSYSTDIDGLYDEFTYNTNRGRGYSGSYTSWQYTVVDVSGISGIYDRVSISHATDTWPQNGSYCCFDDIAIVIY